MLGPLTNVTVCARASVYMLLPFCVCAGVAGQFGGTMAVFLSVGSALHCEPAPAAQLPRPAWRAPPLALVQVR
jgi:hypothetical protein